MVALSPRHLAGLRPRSGREVRGEVGADVRPLALGRRRGGVVRGEVRELVGHNASLVEGEREGSLVRYATLTSIQLLPKE